MSEKSEPIIKTVTSMDQRTNAPAEDPTLTVASASDADVSEVLLIEAWRRAHDPASPSDKD